MNLYIESMAEYLKSEWDQTVGPATGAAEARFIVESLDPDAVFSLFEALDAHRLHCLETQNIVCYFKVAANLWKDWQTTQKTQDLDKKMAGFGGALGPNGERLWIDEEDRLTWYRNRTVQDESAERLVVVLVGLNHASDQGGLADFHRVDESRIWQKMEKGFIPWLSKINAALALEATEPALHKFDAVLQQFFQLRPWGLGKLANYLEREVIADEKFYTLNELIEAFCKKLPKWGLPPLLIKNGEIKADDLKAADAFISHSRYKTDSGQKNDWGKLEEKIDEPDFEIPDTLDKKTQYKDKDDFKKTVDDFIHKACPDAKSKLMNTDLAPILSIIKKKTRKKSAGSQKITSFRGSSIEVFLQAVWQSCVEFEKECAEEKENWVDLLSGVHVSLVRFDHDLDDETAAKALLNGCLGGLDALFSEIDLHLPKDEEEARLPRKDWGRTLPLSLDLQLDKLHYGIKRANPTVQFEIRVSGYKPDLYTNSVFRWHFDANHPERILFESAKIILALWEKEGDPDKRLLAFSIPPTTMTALYFSADEDEANRLLAQAMTDLKLLDLNQSISIGNIDTDIWDSLSDLIKKYRAWLHATTARGYYTTTKIELTSLISSFNAFSKAVLDKNKLGSSELLRRVYKAFLLIDERVKPNDPYLSAAVAWGLSPAVLQLTQARARFLADEFPDVIAEMARKKDGKATLTRLLDLAQIHRPLAALVIDQGGTLSASIKSFGSLHYLGAEPSTEKSLAVQTLLREEESDDDENVRDIVRACEERALVSRVLTDYQQLYPFAEDGLRILAVNVRELGVILAGVDEFLETYLKKSQSDWPAFQCTVTVYSTSSSPMAMEKRLIQWQNHVLERHREKGRALVLSVGHRYAPMANDTQREQVITLLRQEQRRYDMAFLFDFLRNGLDGKPIAALPFESRFDSRFPIAEYPRPIESGDRYRRQSLLSNRRLSVQTCHADLSARLRSDSSDHRDHLIVGTVNHEPWVGLIDALHTSAQWVACVDPFVDKRLLLKEDGTGPQIVGFTSGLGAYGGLNLTISTKNDTLDVLVKHVTHQLTRLLPHADKNAFDEGMAVRIVKNAEEVVGLSSVRAVVGAAERIREVIGFAAIYRALASPSGEMTQLLPVDALSHWFIGADVENRPDLLQLTLVMRPDDLPLIHATVVECKLAENNPAHLSKALTQVQAGLQHLSGLLAPAHKDLARVSFDRRYWWAQLHRAIVSRSVVSLSQHGLQQLDQALERLANGEFEIHWHGVVFTFWTNEKHLKEILKHTQNENNLRLDSPFALPKGFSIEHVALGYQELLALFSLEKPDPLISPHLNEPAISLKPEAAISLKPEENGAMGEQVAPPFSLEEEAVLPSEEAEPSATQKAFQSAELPEENPQQGTEATSQTTPPLVLTPFAVPEQVLIGTRINGEPVFWHFGDSRLDNRHMLILGSSGSGKTYGIQCLLAEMAHQQLRSLIVDYTDGFLPTQVEPRFSTIAKPQNHFVAVNKLPLNPFRRQSQIIDPSLPPIQEKPYQVATRIQSIFSSIFDMGDQQSAALIRVIETGLEENPGFVLDNILPRLREDSQNGESLANKLEPLIKSQPFSGGDQSAWDAMLSSPENRVHVLQLKGLAREIQKMVTEFLLWDLWDYAQNTGNKNRPIPVVLDEIQNLDHSSDSPLDKMLREGRKFGLSLMLATQTTSQFNQEQRDRLFQAGHKLIFKPATTEIDRFAQLLAQSPAGFSRADWAQRLASLEKGQCWSLGRVLKSGGGFKEEAVLVSVTSLENRHF